LANDSLPTFYRVFRSLVRYRLTDTAPVVLSLQQDSGGWQENFPLKDLFFFYLINFEIMRDFDTDLLVLQWKGRVKIS